MILFRTEDWVLKEGNHSFVNAPGQTKKVLFQLFHYNCPKASGPRKLKITTVVAGEPYAWKCSHCWEKIPSKMETFIKLSFEC